MITRISRYFDGKLFQPKHKYTKVRNIVVDRVFPASIKANYFDHNWIDGDSLGKLANDYLGNSKFWWKIMEINPEISDPFYIEPGTVIRIPYGS
jgi:hypothetical protein